MSGFLFERARERVLTGQLDWSSAKLRARLTDVALSPMAEWVSQLPMAKTADVDVQARVEGGLVVADDVTFRAVSSPASWVVLYEDSNGALIAAIEVPTFAAAGGDVTLSFGSGLFAAGQVSGGGYARAGAVPRDLLDLAQRLNPAVEIAVGDDGSGWETLVVTTARGVIVDAPTAPGEVWADVFARMGL